MQFKRTSIDRRLEDEGVGDARSIGGASLTSRHAVQLSPDERVARDAELDSTWASAATSRGAGGGETSVPYLAHVQRKEAHGKAHGHAAPTAGPSEDDRFGSGPVGSDVHGRIVQNEIVGGRTRIGIALGENQGIHVGMTGYVKNGDGMLCDFQIDEVAPRFCHAFVDTTIDGLHGHDQVVVNPTSTPKETPAKPDMPARLVGTSVEGRQVRLQIALGSRHGVRFGMKGYLTTDSGHRARTFTIAELHMDYSVAYVDDDTIDGVHAHSHVILNPSS